MKRLALLSALFSLAALAPGQTLSEYLRLRKQHGVDHAVGVEALGSVSGSKVLELRAAVKGSFRVGTRTTLLVDRTGADQLAIDTVAVPDWLIAGESSARMLVKAIRPDVGSPLRVVLIAAAKDADVRKYDAPPPAPKSAPAPPKVVPAVESSRGGRAPLYGRIGSRHATIPRTAPHTARTWVLPSAEVTPIYAAFIKKANRHLADREAYRMAQAIVGFSIQYRIDPRLVIAMIMVESGFDPNSVSHSGAMGLGQLMPGTAGWMGVRNPFDSVDNLYGMIKLVRTHLDTYRKQTGRDFESLVLTLAAYNAGEGAVRRHGGVPPYRETQAYVRKVLAIYYRLSGLE